MAKQTLDTLKSWVKLRWKPTVQQVKDWMDSYRHKDDKIPIGDIENLTEIINTLPDGAGELVKYEGDGFYDIGDKCLLEKMLLSPGVAANIKIGLVPGGDEIRVGMDYEEGVTVIVLDLHYIAAPRIYFTGLPGGTMINFFKRKTLL